MLEDNRWIIVQKLWGFDQTMCWTLVIKQLIVRFPQLWLFCQNCLPQLFHHFSVVHSVDSLTSEYPMLQNYLMDIKKHHNQIFGSQFWHMWLLPQRHVLAPKSVFLSEKTFSYTWWWWKRSPIKVSSLFSHLKMSENLEESVKCRKNLKFGNKWVLLSQIP